MERYLVSERRATYQFPHTGETAALRTEVQELRAEVQALRAAQQDEKLYVERSLLVEIVGEVIGEVVQRLPQPAQVIQQAPPETAQLMILMAKLVGELETRNQLDMQRHAVSLSTHAEKVPENQCEEAPISEDDIYEVGGVKYLKNNSQTRVSGHTQTQAKRANKARGGGVSYTPDILCLDTGFRQCVEAGMSKSKLGKVWRI